MLLKQRREVKKHKHRFRTFHTNQVQRRSLPMGIDRTDGRIVGTTGGRTNKQVTKAKLNITDHMPAE